MTRWRLTCAGSLLILVSASICVRGQSAAQPDWAAIEQETLTHFQALLRFDTSDPPGGEEPAANYLKEVLEKEGILVQMFALEPHRPNVVARLKGSGRKRPLLLMGHTDVVNVDPSKWKQPPFGAVREGGYIYGRGAIDDKDSVTAGLMTMLLLKRLKLSLDRDVIFLAEAGEEGSTNIGINFMVEQHYRAIDAEYCLAESGEVTRIDGEIRRANVQVTEKMPRTLEIVASGVAGHGSAPRRDNAIVRVGAAVAAIGRWKPPMRLTEPTAMFFSRLAEIAPPERAAHYRALLSLDPNEAAAADEWLAENAPGFSAVLRNTLSPTILKGGYRANVIPSEATATVDVRLLPGEDPETFLEAIRGVVNDPSLAVHWAVRDQRPGASNANLTSEVFKAIEAAVHRFYNAVTLPTMSPAATDMAFLRSKGMERYGIGPVIDVEDGPNGFGAHGDQERILESELHRFVRFNWEIVTSLARAQR